MAGLTVGFTDDNDNQARVTIEVDGVQLTFDSETAKWLADDLETWAERVDQANRARKKNDQ